MNNIFDNITHTHKKISKACEKWNVDKNAIKLIAVSKKQPHHKILSALDAGHLIYGENQVQDAKARWESHLQENDKIELHLIGPLQSNKVKDAVALFDYIHSVDRPKLARALVKEIKAQNKNIKFFVQINTGEEPQKSGILPSDFEEFYHFCRNEGLEIYGLMCIPPVDEPPAHHFALLQKMARDHNIQNLSIGMSGDFEKAIPFQIPQGKLYIRVGTAIFGARET